MAAANQEVPRLLAMVPYLLAHPGVEVAQVAEIFGVTPKRVLEDLNILWMCGTAGGLPDELIEIDMDAAKGGNGVIHLSNADYLPKPLRFSAQEAMSLLIGLQGIQEMATGELLSAANSAAEKLGSFATAAPVLIEITSGDAEIRAKLIEAIEAEKVVRLSYDNANRSETTTPVVDPVAIVMRDSVAYLRGWAHTPDAERTYRLDRITAVEILDLSAAQHELATSDDQWFSDETTEVTLTLAAGAAWVPEYFPAREVTSCDDGSLIVRLAVTSQGWLDGLLLRLGDQVLAVAPPEAGESARATADQLVERYLASSK